MQSRRRKSRIDQKYRESDRDGRKASTGLLACALIGAQVLLVSCSHNANSKKNTVRLQDAIAGLCLNGQGKGRLETRRERLVFSYASTLSDELWHLGLRFPLHGEEDLKIKFPPAGIKQPSIASGPLVKRFESGLGQRRSRQLLSQLGKLVSALPSSKVVCEGQKDCVLKAYRDVAIVNEAANLAYLDFGNNALTMRLYLPALDKTGAKWSLVWWNASEKDPIKEQILLFPGDCGR